MIPIKVGNCNYLFRFKCFFAGSGSNTFVKYELVTYVSFFLSPSNRLINKDTINFI